MAALRLVCSAPSVNPAAARLCRSFPSMQRLRAPDSHRSLCTKLQPNVMRLNWRTPLPRPPVRTHLPVDALAHLTLPLLEGLSFAPLFPAHLLPREGGLPPFDVMTAAYRGLQGRSRRLLLEDWKRLAPPPNYYSFPLRLSPHPFMGLGKFMAGRIHQMRAQKSYLVAHPSWSDGLAPTKLCPRCGEEEETFTHAILRCPARAVQRERLLQGVTDLAPDAPIWYSPNLLLALASFVRSTRTNFPPDMFGSPPGSPPEMVLPSPTQGRAPRSLFAPPVPRPL